MIEQAQNKAMESKSTQEYHFAGSTIYRPMTIKAATLEEATALWEKQRVPVEPAKTPAKPETKENIN